MQVTLGQWSYSSKVPYTHNLDTSVVFKGIKKDAALGMRAWRELLDPARNHSGTGKSVMAELFPGIKELILSGDTGNGAPHLKFSPRGGGGT